MTTPAEPIQLPSRKRPTRYRPMSAVGMHAMRVVLFLAIIWSIRQRHVEYRARQARQRSSTLAVDRLTRFYPTAARIEGWDESHAGQMVLNAADKQLGYVVQTSPQSDHVVGYSGPTNCLLAFDTQDRVLGIDILTSSDTREHVADVLENDRFMRVFNGLSWQQAASRRDLDGVSGATLTSLAILEGISYRLGSPRPSLRFPDHAALTNCSRFCRQRPGFRRGRINRDCGTSSMVPAGGSVPPCAPHRPRTAIPVIRGPPTA